MVKSEKLTKDKYAFRIQYHYFLLYGFESKTASSLCNDQCGLTGTEFRIKFSDPEHRQVVGRIWVFF